MADRNERRKMARNVFNTTRADLTYSNVIETNKVECCEWRSSRLPSSVTVSAADSGKREGHFSRNADAVRKESKESRLKYVDQKAGDRRPTEVEHVYSAAISGIDRALLDSSSKPGSARDDRPGSGVVHITVGVVVVNTRTLLVVAYCFDWLLHPRPQFCHPPIGASSQVSRIRRRRR